MWKRILIISACALVVLGASLYQLLSSLLSERHTLEAEARALVAEKTNIAEIDTIEEYRGREAYIVVTGKNKVGTPVVAWFSKEHVTFDLLEKAFPRTKVKQVAEASYPGAQIERIVPGLEGDKKLWEVTLVDKQNRYNYVYYDFLTGQKIRAYTLNIPKS
ncbi:MULTISPECIES: DUF5590 domain-containing protein [Brevibacillus]|uniref:Cell wall elongation regulator TseB-like domain-containing protein n=1 Tax=Brevibacillus laterosporus LMG 15441 TaxID=1042163 RepID=A0A075R130_BRELA|nr:DUF5590 domain-containing protein [Brevibacillus laterosporus]MBA4534808.1 DUF5590 domain-containing protein [Brevibacillus halotolerans]AIG26282.1 hypothetical protein BRLA_c019610 [Brevibacillus laterosporus LMG 15441]AUM64861.1 hypothetical protein C0R09_10130 [Brevibacillus laterosporus]AYK07858.1 hypothetical protein D8Z77_16580 [Brevibacillus laterosporus]ERM20108.1 hypothetical protein P615_07465 [Brevibacillus laterosporus PE36]